MDANISLSAHEYTPYPMIFSAWSDHQKWRRSNTQETSLRSGLGNLQPAAKNARVNNYIIKYRYLALHSRWLRVYYMFVI